MEFKHLKSFHAVSELLHFRRAAQRVGVTQPALSQHILKLEAELGVRLLERDRRTVKLTPAGQTLRDETASVLTQLESVSPYALTGAVFARDRAAIVEADRVLRFAAGNFYVNDKPTGAVVGQQPFGGGRASGTNDKAGSMWNLIRWVSPRSIKETFVPPTSYRYPFLDGEPDSAGT